VGQQSPLYRHVNRASAVYCGGQCRPRVRRRCCPRAISAELGNLMGQQSAELLQTAIQNAAQRSTGVLAAVVDHYRIGRLHRDAADPEHNLACGTISRLIRVRAVSLGLVGAPGFLLLVSLVISSLLSALSDYINAYLPSGHLILQTLMFLIHSALSHCCLAQFNKGAPRQENWLA
jgi:membrane protein